ncbi:MAG TPA: fluoride efflux transporter CrcB [Armatimonadota bacterium]|nr:fluoride efflux transporter CrcB [Armatimonadota bacterium]
MEWILTAAGGAVGAVARYGLGGYIAARVSPSFPLGTLTINVTGSFLIGLVMALLSAATPLSADLQALLVTGALGGYTTFSTYEYESLQLALTRSRKSLALNLIGSVVVGLLGAWIGAIAGGSIRAAL